MNYIEVSRSIAGLDTSNNVANGAFATVDIYIYIYIASQQAQSALFFLSHEVRAPGFSSATHWFLLKFLFIQDG